MKWIYKWFLKRKMMFAYWEALASLNFLQKHGSEAISPKREADLRLKIAVERKKETPDDDRIAELSKQVHLCEAARQEVENLQKSVKNLPLLVKDSISKL